MHPKINRNILFAYHKLKIMLSFSNETPSFGNIIVLYISFPLNFDDFLSQASQLNLCFALIKPRPGSIRCLHPRSLRLIPLSVWSNFSLSKLAWSLKMMLIEQTTVHLRGKKVIDCRLNDTCLSRTSKVRCSIRNRRTSVQNLHVNIK